MGQAPVRLAGGVVFDPAASGIPINVGAVSGTGLHLSNAELARVFTTATGTITFGNPSFTSNITFAGASPATTAGASVAVLQSPNGSGAIVLDGSAGTALDVGTGNIQLSAGTGGIVATGVGSSLATSGQVTLDTAGGIGIAANRIVFGATATPPAVTIGSESPPAAGAYLGGLGSLTLAGALTVNSPLDITAALDLTVLPSAVLETGTDTLSLAAGTNPDGSSASAGVLTIGTGAVVASENSGDDAITLVGSGINIATGIAPAIVGGHLDASNAAPSTLTGLNGPAGLAFDASGNLYVTNFGNNFNGTTVSVFAPGSATPTSTLTGLSFPSALRFDSSGNLYVINTNTNSVEVFAPQATTPTSTLTGLDDPTALAFDSSDNLYVANADANTVSVYSPGSTTPTRTLTGLDAPVALAFDSSGNLYVANTGTNTVSVFAPNATTPTSTLTEPSSPQALAIDASGNIYVGNDTTVSVFAPGSTTPTRTLTGLNSPSAMAFDSRGTLYVANFGQQTVAAPEGSGTTVSVFAPGSTTPNATLTGLSGPTALAFDSSGNLYVASAGSNSISVFPGPPPPVPVAGGVVIRNAQPGQPINVGSTSGTGLSLSDAELARIFTVATGTITIGDPSQTGNITFAGATPATTPGASVLVIQSPTGGGAIMLDGSLQTALSAGTGNVQLSAGTGGILAEGAASSLATTGQVSLNTTGGIGTVSQRILFDAAATPASVAIGSTSAPSVGAYLGGLGSLTLGGVSTANSPLDVTAALNLTVAPSVVLETGTGTLALAAGVNPDGSGGSAGVLSIDAGAVVASDASEDNTITLRGTDINIATGANPAIVTANPSALNSTATTTPVASAGGVVLRTAQAGEPISIGATFGAGLILSDAELAQLFTSAGGAVTIGDPSNTGDILVAGSISRHTGFDTLILQTQAGVINAASGVVLSVANLALQAGIGIGTTGPMAIGATHLAFASQSGTIQLSDANAVTLMSIGPVSASTIPGDVFSAANVGDSFTLLHTGGGVTGQITYNGLALAQDATLTLADGNHYRIDYTANGGQDVTLTRIASLTLTPPVPPSPGAGAGTGSGSGPGSGSTTPPAGVTPAPAPEPGSGSPLSVALAGKTLVITHGAGGRRRQAQAARQGTASVCQIPARRHPFVPRVYAVVPRRGERGPGRCDGGWDRRHHHW